MNNLKEYLESLDCKQFTSLVRDHGYGNYEQYFPLVAGKVESFSSLEMQIIETAASRMELANPAYSKFNVGASILADNGKIYSGSTLKLQIITVCTQKRLQSPTCIKGTQETLQQSRSP